jgi:hypothetical protein
MNTLGDVKAEIRGLVGDPRGEWANDAYLTPLINTTYRLQVLQLKNATSQNLEGVVLLPNVPGGTTSLYEFQAVGQPLCGIYTVLEIYSKPAGTPPNYFRPAGERRFPAHVAPPVTPQGLTATVGSYCWLGNKLLITPPAVAVDIEVTGRFNPPPLVKDGDVLVASPDMQSVTACGTAAVAGVERTNPAILEGYAQMAFAGLDNIAAELIRQKQGITQRPGLMDGGYGYRWR